MTRRRLPPALHAPEADREPGRPIAPAGLIALVLVAVIAVVAALVSARGGRDTATRASDRPAPSIGPTVTGRRHAADRVPSTSQTAATSITSTSTTSTPRTSIPVTPVSDDTPLPVTLVGGIPSVSRIRPTAIVLHWWASTSGSRISALVAALRGQIGYYDPAITKARYYENMRTRTGGHELGVQFGVTQDGRAYQLTPWPDSYAAHAACANRWAIGIEIEGRGAADLASHPVQQDAVVRLVRALMARYSIPVDGPLDPGGNAGVGVHSHKQVDALCKFADGSSTHGGKIDVDDAYLAAVKAQLGGAG